MGESPTRTQPQQSASVTDMGRSRNTIIGQALCTAGVALAMVPLLWPVWSTRWVLRPTVNGVAGPELARHAGVVEAAGSWQGRAFLFTGPRQPPPYSAAGPAGQTVLYSPEGYQAEPQYGRVLMECLAVLAAAATAAAWIPLALRRRRASGPSPTPAFEVVRPSAPGSGWDSPGPASSPS